MSTISLILLFVYTKSSNHCKLSKLSISIKFLLVILSSYFYSFLLQHPDCFSNRLTKKKKTVVRFELLLSAGLHSLIDKTVATEK